MMTILANPVSILAIKVNILAILLHLVVSPSVLIVQLIIIAKKKRLREGLKNNIGIFH